MTYVVTDNCQGCMYTDCVEVCPVDCFYGNAENDKMLYIHPDECIDCGACEPVCPVQAIFAEENLSEDKKKWTEVNAKRSTECENISEKRDPLPGADEKKKALGL
jgi:ferredoxin